MIGKWFRWVAVVAIGLLVAGCYRDYGPVAAEPEPVVATASAATYLQTGDVLKVTVYGEEGLTGQYTISPFGDVAMPLIGNVHAAGLTKSALQRAIADRYASGKFLQEPNVTVDVLSYRPIYVVGEILRPGAYPYSSGLTVLTAITLAGGPTYRASRANVYIQHPGDPIWQEYPMVGSVTVMPGDLIRVPERYF